MSEATFVPTIGLEIHAELKTHSKMFCGCANRPDSEAPNKLICPVCMAHPGTLPVINREAVRQVLRVGYAVNGTIADFTEFDRKNYFYPDIPKGYQISQFKYPLVSGGKIGTIDITRIHLEEDTARSTHGDVTSSVDFNRAGVPLMELVTEPVIHDSKTAVSFARDLMLCLRYIGASDANLDRGEMRVEANISIAEKGAPLGTKVEVKNLNSFKAVEQAIAFEIKRHTSLVQRGEKVVQETRGWDENKQRTFSQRLKEDSHDYRYFPDPDLPKLKLSLLSELKGEVLRKTLPTLPWELRKEYHDAAMSEHVVETFVGNPELNTFYRSVVALLSEEKQRKLATNYITSDLLGLLALPENTDISIAAMDPKEFSVLMEMAADGTVSSRGTKDTLAVWVRDGGDPQSIAKKIGVQQNSDEGDIIKAVRAVLEEQPAAVTDYRAGKEAALQFLVGQGMRATKGAANPGLLREILIKELA